MATTSGLMTVEQFWELPDDPAFQYELHHGEEVKMSRPGMRHYRLQRRLRQLLERIFADRGIVDIKMPFRALPEHELRAADVGFVSPQRWEQATEHGAVAGAPEIVIEILSPSNTAAEMIERCAICLENGTKEFWVVSEKRREIRVSTPDGLTRTYKSGDSIPLALADGQFLAVDDVFGE